MSSSSPPVTAPQRVVPFVAALVAGDATRTDATALIGRDGRPVTYRQLASRVDDVVARIGGRRRLVQVAARNDVASIVGYLGALAGGHAVLLTSSEETGNAAGRLGLAYDPDVVVSSGARGDDHGGVDADTVVVNVRRDQSMHDLHPDLALLLSTSGSTGSAKLVRLSHDNLQSNAEAIASYLRINPADRAATTLPLHYCYGLSVVHSHLLAGAALIVTDTSVIEPVFWDQFAAGGGTTFSGVPYTFDLLDRVGFDRMRLRQLRYVTQAGGRMPADVVARYAELAARDGWELFVMYGQTEATARMAYLPPALAVSRPNAIGVAIPGGTLSVDVDVDVDADAGGGDVGELVYAGPNVMLGYATIAADLARGRDVNVLRTGDLARRADDGLFEIVGRSNRFIKPFGLRIDLDQCERALADRGLAAACTGDDGTGVVVAVLGRGRDEGAAREEVLTAGLGIPASAVHVVCVDEWPRLATGKVDYAAIRDSVAKPSVLGRRRPAIERRADVRALFADVLQRDNIDEASTFVELGGDSLSYVEMSVRLEETLGHLPDDWHVTPVGELAPTESAGRRRTKQVETNVVLRAVSIVLVVTAHAGVFGLKGGGHLLLALAGYNFARFQLGVCASPGRVIRSATRIAVPAIVWIAVLLLTTNDYDPWNLALLYGHVGEPYWDQRWRYWYIEAIVQILIAFSALLAVPRVRRWQQMRPFWFAVGALGVALVVREVAVSLFDATRVTHRPQTVAWLFVLGWLVASVSSTRQRMVASALVLASVAGFFVNDGRSWTVTSGMLALLLVPRLRVPPVVAALVGAVGSASLYIYLVHWQVYPAMVSMHSPMLGVIASLLVGFALWRTVGRLPRLDEMRRLPASFGSRGTVSRRRRIAAPAR